MQKIQTSQKLFNEAQKHLVGGVNSPVRAFKAVGGNPLFIVRAKGSRVWDADGNEYIDYVGSFGPAILGHADPSVLNALNQVMKNGTSFGAPTVLEIELALEVKKAYPSIDLIRFVNSGTEATMGAIRVARGFTKKNKIIKFDGCYHGHADYLLVKAGSGATTLGIPDSAGVPSKFASLTLVANYNDLNSVKNIFQENKNEVACVIIEPIVGNMGCMKPEPHFLKELIQMAHENHALVIFDEVMTGFRVAFGGAQELYKLKPDLTCLGKIIGGGLPVGAYGGRKEIMECVAPLGPVYQAGTLSGNPLAMAAGLVTLKKLQEKNVYQKLEEKGHFLEEGIKSAAHKAAVPLQLNRVGSMFSIFFSDKPVLDAQTALHSNTKNFSTFFHTLIDNGIYTAPSPFEAGFISLAHTVEDLEKTIEAYQKAFGVL